MEKEIIEFYKAGKTNKEIANIFNIHRVTVQRILKRNYIELNSKAQTARKHKILNFNDIITNNDAYILGLIWADGNLSKSCIEISLHEKDKQILTDISNYIYSYEQLGYRDKKSWLIEEKIYQSSPQYRFLICSKEITNKLKLIGLCENKSLKIRFPILDKKFYSHFIRGIFDGDGCIFISKKYKGTNRVTIVSNPLFCKDLKEIIEKNININVCIQNKTKNVKQISISGNNQIKKFMSWIYTDSDLKLNRKYYKYIKEYNPVDDAVGNAEALLYLQSEGFKLFK